VNLLFVGAPTGAGVQPLPGGELLRISLLVPFDASGTGAAARVQRAR
jgi:hypothetical protein